ncbi:uncharacterized protein LOC128217341 isoform X2 [Mya arenaria]|nr:uncharacterized protein LOC128217341 isoform X2 [Mya arenaria]XP_052780400.1 uncharacterized protein LOC128217341 isoform X2 [Mya arenaria]
MKKTRKEDKLKRDQLIDLVKHLSSIVQSFDNTDGFHFLQDFLSKEGTTSNIVHDCEEHVKQLTKDETIILVAGETSSGKSSFLNLLLGIEVLPTNTLSCTSIITTIRYGKKQEFKINYKNGLQYSTDKIEEFQKIAFPKENRDEDHGIQEAEVYITTDILKCGIVLVDSPGIGENDFLEQYLIDFVSTNEINAFTYLIFTDNHGGVIEDRLLHLLKVIIQERKKKVHSIPFDPQSALFVANRFDRVQIEYQAEVKTHITAKLKGCYPQFDSTRLVFFSTLHAKRDVDADESYINEHFKELLLKISTLHSHVLDTKIRFHYRWMAHILHRIQHCLKTLSCRLSMTQKDSADRTLKQRQRLKTLQNESTKVLNDVKATIDEKSKVVRRDVVKILTLPATKLRLCSIWKAGEIPEITDISRPAHLERIKRCIDDAFFDRLFNEVEEWEEEENATLANIEEQLSAKLQEGLNFLRDKIFTSEACMRRSDVSNSSSNSLSDSRSSRESGTRDCLLELPLQMPRKLKHRLHPFRSLLFQHESKTYVQNPEEWAHRRAEKLLNKILMNERAKGSTKGTLDIIVEVFMQRPLHIYESLKEKVPSLIEANMELTYALEEMVLNHRQNARLYMKGVEKIEYLKMSLRLYGDGCLYVNDFKDNEIKVKTIVKPNGIALSNCSRSSIFFESYHESESDKPACDVKGMWSCILPGYVQQASQASDVAIRMYTEAAGDIDSCREVATIRCLTHNDYHIASFLGIHFLDTSLPVYIYDGALISLNNFKNMKKCSRSQIRNMITNIAQGLNYLHMNGLVHMELSEDMVTVNAKGDIRLTGACIPRLPTFPADKDSCRIGRYVYFPFEVLNGQIYTRSSDVYSFGLLMFEVLFMKKAFDDHKLLSFNEFVESFDPEHNLHLHHGVNLSWPERTLSLIKLCLKKTEFERLTMATVVEVLSDTGVHTNGFIAS